VVKGRESGMPAAEQWDRFFDPGAILQAFGCDCLRGDVVEFGCGYGSFTIPAAQRSSGTVYALDIDPLMVIETNARLSKAKINNVVVEQRDFVEDGSGRPDGSASFVMLFNILHIEDPVSLLREAHRVLRVGGISGVIHWKHDVSTPRGPSLDIRPRMEQCATWGMQAGFRSTVLPDLPGSPWHWGMKLER
jgi:SAM-dependent methyltransferase